MTPKLATETNARVPETVTQTPSDDQQVHAISADIKSIVEVAVMANDISYIKGDIAEIKAFFTDMKLHFVSRDEFAPIRTIAYGITGAILLAVLGAVVALVLK